MHWWTFMQGNSARWHLRKRGLMAWPQWTATALHALAPRHKHRHKFLQQARSRTRAVSSEGLVWLSPWRACEANMILEFSEVQEPEQFLSSMNTSWPLYMVILQWHQRSWLQIDCLNKKSGLMIFIFYSKSRHEKTVEGKRRDSKQWKVTE